MTELQEAAQRALNTLRKQYGKQPICCGCPVDGHPGDGWMQPPDPPTCCQQFEADVGMLLDEIAAALANEPQAEPVRKLTYEDADEIPCPHCGGAGTETSLSGGGPDAYDVEHDCSHCAGNQTLGAAYRTLIQDLKAAQMAHTDACARLYAVPPAEQPGAVVLSEREACALACDEAKAKSRNHLFRSGLSIAAGVIRARSAAKSAGELPPTDRSAEDPAHPGVHPLDDPVRAGWLACDRVPERVPPGGLERAGELPAPDHQSGHRHIVRGPGLCGGLAAERFDDGGMAEGVNDA